MTKDKLKPIDVRWYEVTETGQVLKMTKDELAKKADTNHTLVSQLAELEAENAELKARINILEIYLEGAINYLILDGDVDNYIIDCAERILHTTFNRSHTFKEKRISELEKENLELKEEVKNKSLEQYAVLADEKADEVKSKLTKAKEIIKRLMDIINHDLKCFDTVAGGDIKQKAEQFLKDER